MDKELQIEFARFGNSLALARAFAELAVLNDEILVEFAARGVQKKDLQKLIDTSAGITASLYATPQPV